MQIKIANGFGFFLNKCLWRPPFLYPRRLKAGVGKERREDAKRQEPARIRTKKGNGRVPDLQDNDSPATEI